MMQEMLIRLGPPGSGKTTRILEQVRARLRAGRADFRCLVPTSTMQEHLTNLLAREGLLVRTSAIVTLAGFVDELAGVAAASSEDVRMLTALVLEERCPPALEALRGSPGMAGALAAAIDELANTGCDAAQWAGLGSLRVWEGPALRALGQVYEAVDEALRERKLARRPEQLAAAMRALQSDALQGVDTVFVDGFFTFSPFEMELLVALARKVRLEIALPEWSGAREAVERLRRQGFQLERLTVQRPQAENVLLPTPNRHREAEQIALRILEARRQQGLAWRECGVVMRARHPYGPLLETAFDRFGIPWRAYYAAPLNHASAARCLMGLVDACVAGWEHESTLHALGEPACRAAVAPEFARFAKSVRDGLPAEGLAPLARSAEGPVREVVETLSAWPGSDGAVRTPNEWAETLTGLLPVLRPPEPGDVPGRGAAVRTLLRTAESAARLLADESVTLERFREMVWPALAGATLRDAGRRRDAVHLLDAYEARQWELPLVFVCGLVEGEFPRHRSPDALLPDSLRLRLRQQGVPVRLGSDLDAEERFVFEIAQSRATRQTVYSWPEFNEQGDPALRSFELDMLPAATVATRGVRVRPVVEAPPLPLPSLDNPVSRATLSQRFEVQRPTSLESFLQCPFQFYLRFTLGLEDEPETPGERLNPLFTGNVLHDVLKDWHQKGGDIATLFDSVWTRALARYRIPPGHAAEYQRCVLRRSLVEYSQRAPQSEEGWKVFVEWPFELQLEGCRVKGRIDRFDVNRENEARVFDYKFTSAASLRRRYQRQADGLSLQGGLYLLALARQGLRPLSFHYIGVKNEVTWKGWDSGEEVLQLMEQSRLQAQAAAFRIIEGQVAVAPADSESCQWCEFQSACRVHSTPAGRTTEAGL